MSKKHKNSNEFLIIKSIEKENSVDRPFSNNDIQRIIIKDSGYA
jgi:hypothetical protein